MSKVPFTTPTKDFLGKPAPPGYIAGLGRGATGFTTRSDIGPARDPTPSSSFGRGNALAIVDDSQRKKIARLNDDDDDEEESYMNERNYDEFAGYSGSLFSKDPYEDDDQEADKIYEQIDKHLDERGKALREAKLRQAELESSRERPKIQQQFADLKVHLRGVTEQEWANIPEVGDARNRKQRVARQDKFTPVPDSLLAHQARIAMGGEKLVYIEPTDAVMATSDDEDDNQASLKTRNVPTGDNGVNIGDMSDYRGSVMSMRLSHTTSGNQQQKPEDAKNYLTNLDSFVTNQITDTATIEEYRKYFKSLRRSNPDLENIWIVSARLEESAGKLKTARELVVEGCDKNRLDVELWCEAARLHPRDKAKSLMVLALKYNPKSVKLWLRAADLEATDNAKRVIYQKALELVPKSELLWKKAIELEEPDRARDLLRRAVEFCPDAVDLWLSLAKLEPYEKAQKILIKASDKNPTAISVWIMAAKLEERAKNNVLVKSIINLAIKKVLENKKEINRDQWFQEAIDADKENYKLTSSEIINRMIGWNLGKDVSLEERLKAYLEEAEKFVTIKSINCARAVYEYIVDDSKYAQMEKVWLSYANLERCHGTRNLEDVVSVKKEPCDSEDKVKKNKEEEEEDVRVTSSLEQVLKRSIKKENCFNSETLWLMLAEELKSRNVEETRQVLSDALDANPDSERVILAAVELECENHNYEEARRILTDACESAKTARLIKRWAKLEWSLGNIEAAIVQLKGGIEDYKDFPDFYLMLGQIEEQRSQDNVAKSYYSNGLKFNPTSVPLWISIASLEEKTGFVARARSKLELARKRNPKVPLLWLEAAKLEMRAYMAKKAKSSCSSSSSSSSLGGIAGGQGVSVNVRPDIVTSILAKGIRECKGEPDVKILLDEQAILNKKKFV